MRAQSKPKPKHLSSKRKSVTNDTISGPVDPPVVSKALRWYVDAGLIMTTSQGRCTLQQAYGRYQRTFAEHVEAIAKYAEFLVWPVWNDQWGVEEIAVSQFLFAFQPLGLENKDMLPFQQPNENHIILELWKAVDRVFTPYVHTLAERSANEKQALVSKASIEQVFRYKYKSPTPCNGRSVWNFLDQEEVRKSREILEKLEGENQIIQLEWKEKPVEPKRSSFAAYGPYIAASVE
jgi:hypothetical protein